MFSKEEYIARREKLRQSVGTGLILFLGNDEVGSNFKDNVYPFRQDSSFIYFFGIQAPGLNAIIDVDGNEEIIFGDDLSIDDIVFSGPTTPLKERANMVGVANVMASDKLSDYLGGLKTNTEIHYLPPYRPEHILKLSSLLGSLPSEIEKGASTQLIKGVVKLRSIKSEEEVLEIEKAVNTTVEMQYKAMELAKPGITEADLFGAVKQIALANGNNTSFPTIMTVNGQILHNHYRKNILKTGDMVLCDCGAEGYSNYAGDLTRTFPVDEKFTDRQKRIYDIVYSAYRAAVDKLAPGCLFLDVHLAACQKIVEGLIDLGIMKGSASEAIAEGAHTLFFQCGLGHMLGLDVHDMENLGEQYVGYTDDLKQRTDFGFKSLRLGRMLEEGMVLTVEPGIYFIPELIALRKRAHKFEAFVDYGKLEDYMDLGGIRIEDDFLITAKGSRLLGNRLPSTSDEIEQFRITKQRI
ncbi:aminopeptidase P family protein [uncultured Kriegella sp.]|uniref:aminopeptidase P family protein n=1 Tax=uncultured Kriegella sp. TaxID=1798910 RepID=UPI0030D6F077|tara:strand:- start:64368 stop:65765 length:1398 start_codon:yes stop_codon:yes gene_type:complete